MTTVTAGYEVCPTYAPVFGYIGAAGCMILANFGAAWGTWKAGLGVCKMGINYPSGVIKNIIPIVMAGVLGIYGLIVAVIITQSISSPTGDGYTTYSLYSSYAHLAAGLCCGISCLAAGGTIGVIGDVGVQCFGLRASGGKRAWTTGEGANPNDAGDGAGGMDVAVTAEAANKLYVGLLIMLIFAEALALYGLIVALILSQNQYVCG
jgi:V-type H+-transporting ATPase proteolipid subunit|eukprot:scaffold1465_cov222-Chaetoceros_neogracile.AAC.4